MEIKYNYTLKNIFGMGEDVSAVATANEERINKVFRHMKSNRECDYSVIILGKYAFYYQTLSDYENDNMTVQYTETWNQISYESMTYKKARKFALDLLEKYWNE